jgi:uncharacterized protein (TIGR04551 family)
MFTGVTLGAVPLASAQDAPAPAAPAPAAPAAPANGAEPAAEPRIRPRLMPDSPRPLPGANAQVAAEPRTPEVKPEGASKDVSNPNAQAPKEAAGGVDTSIGAAPSMVYSEEWWSHTRPVLELHGYFRTRGELFHNFFLGRRDDPFDSADRRQYLFPQPLDNSYSTYAGTPRTIALCGSPNAAGQYENCFNKSQAHANLRLRLNPELHISDNLRIMTQIDALDNLVMGSTPDSYYAAAASTNPNARSVLESQSQGAPTAGINSTRNSIEVKRAWAEYLTPVGQLRFGRMPFHWGMGMLYNAGDQVDQDFQTNMDRIMFVSGIRSMDLYFGGSWDFVGTGPTSQSPYDVYGGQPFNTSNRTNVGQWQLFATRRTSPETQRLALARGDVVLNGGVLGTLRTQELDLPPGKVPEPNQSNFNYERVGATLVTPDLWVQMLYKKLRVEAEGAMVIGSIDKTPLQATASNNSNTVLMAGFTAEADYRAIDDKLRVAFGTGWSSGDPGLLQLNPGPNRFTHGPGKVSMFRFHPGYNIDLILHRRILQRVQGTYYFRPSVDYDFIRNPNGQRFGGSAAIIWTRASEFIQTPGHARDLGVELNASVYYQAKDGSLNDDPKRLGGFYAMLQYGVLFPLGGFDAPTTPATVGQDLSTSVAQTVRLHLGVVF